MEREAAQAAGKRDDNDDEARKPGASAVRSGKKPGGRQALPLHLKRERIVHDLAHAEKHCTVLRVRLTPPLGKKLVNAMNGCGAITASLQYVPASVTVIEEACLKYAVLVQYGLRAKPPQPLKKALQAPAC